MTPDRPWTIEYQRSIRTDVADVLATSYIFGNGLWIADRLVGINTWADDRDPFIGSAVGQVWRSSLLAVATDYRNRGIGRRLKEQLIDDARSAGVEAITSMVRWDNTPMRDLNRKLGGSEVPIPRDHGHDQIHCWNIVPVRRT